MKLRSIAVMLLALCLSFYPMLPAIKTAKARTFRSILFDPFSGPTVFDDFSGSSEAKWWTYRGNTAVVPAGGRPHVLRLAHPQQGGELGQFGDSSSTSVFLGSPATAGFADGMIEFDLFFENSGWEGVSAMLTFRMQSDDTYYALRLTSTRDWYGGFMIYKRFSGWSYVGATSPWGVFPTGAWSHVSVIIGGSRMSCYKDGELICSLDDSTWSKGNWGGIGLQNNYYGGVFYIDNFRIPERIKWTPYRGSPRIDSAYGKSGSSVLFDHPSTGGDDAPFGDVDSCSMLISGADLQSFRNGVIEFDMLFNDGGQKAFFVFRMQSDSSYYAARITSTYDWSSYFVRRISATDWYVMGSQSYHWAIAPNYWTHITIIIDGSHFEMWRDWERLYSADDVTIFQGSWGGLGFYSAYKDGVFHIDNLKICIES